MHVRIYFFAVLSLILAGFGGISCGGGGDGGCDPVANTGCDGGQFCEQVQGGEASCFAPVTLTGTVTDLETGQVIAGARVVALDVNGSAVSDVVVTDASGNYTILVSSARNPDGTPVDQVFLRADAAGYESFPGGLREGFPIDLSLATESNGSFTLDSSLTDIALVALPGGAPSASIQGTVPIPQDQTSVLVVAELVSGDPCPVLPQNNCSSIAGPDGSFAIYNLPAGSYNVRAFVSGSNYAPVPVTLANTQVVTGLALTRQGDATATLNGNLNYVNAGTQQTTVILAVKSTVFSRESGLVTGLKVFIRGQTPPGLRDGDAGSTFSIPGVPDGNYLILASFENDQLVRDPDICISGTKIIEIGVTNGQITSSESLDNPIKITGALEVIAPTPNQAVSATPTLTWEDDSSETGYEIIVYDSLGQVVWDARIDGVSGSGTVSVTYGQAVLEEVTPPAPLQSGGFYQFHVISLKPATSGQCSNISDYTGISQTEDLKGAFQVQ